MMMQCAIISLLALLFIPSSALAQSCAANPVAVQILGSGGPRVNRDRASSSYLLWIDAQARVLVDIGGGAFLRFGQAQAQLSDLSLVAISHLHPDHVSDLPALLWLSNQTRKEPLPIAGPSGNDLVPRLSDVPQSPLRCEEGRISSAWHARWVIRSWPAWGEAFVSMSVSLM